MNPLDVAVGLLLGLSLAAPPGPMNALIAREASHHGARHAFRVGVAAPIADLLYLGLLLAGLEFILVEPWLPRVAAGLGSLVMAAFAWGTVRPRTPGEVPRATFLQAFAMAAANPFQLTWWLTAGFAFLSDEGLAGVAGFTLAIFGWVAAFSWLCAKGAGRWPWFEPAVAVMSADLLLGFAMMFVAKAAFG